MEPPAETWLTRHAAAVKDWWWKKLLRALFRVKARHLRIETGVVYGHANGQELTLDLAMPLSGGPFPALVTIPGGGWEWIAQPDSMHILDEMLAEHGFAAAELSYRLAPKDKYPAQIEDCKAAVRWLRANAAKYNIDPERIGALGFSSGAQLACLLGVTNPSDGLEGEGVHPEQSSRVDAVVSFFGPTDFTLQSWRDRYEKRLMLSVLGGTFAMHPELYERASPVYYVRPGMPPHLFFHGTADDIVPIEHSRLLATRLQAVGASARLVEVPGQGHGAWPRGVFNPCLEEAVRFLQENLK
ncbi:MAG: alpha/beta hydrolase [Gemmataceae bacterium]|nr:alpha/beta hydrolase [Gemmataceae bacterium]